jgi:hypothetical protein
MRTPRLEIYLDDKSELCIAKVERDGAEPRLIFDVDLTELHAQGEDEASKRVGGTILHILKIWHKDTFEKLGVFNSIENTEESDFDLAMELIGKSVLSKTGAHVPSIELLLRQSAKTSESVQHFLDETWPTVRATLIAY